MDFDPPLHLGGLKRPQRPHLVGTVSKAEFAFDFLKVGISDIYNYVLHIASENYYIACNKIQNIFSSRRNIQFS